MPLDLPPAPSLLTLPKPAIVRAVGDLNRHDRRAIEREFGVKFPELRQASLPGTAPVVSATALVPVTLEYTDLYTSAADASTYTAANRTIGAASSDRIVVIATTGGSGAQTVSSVTIAGGAATIRSSATNGAIASRLVISGTTATIVVNWSGTTFRTAIAVYTLKGASSGGPRDESSTYGATNSVTIDVPSGGVW